MDKQQVKIVPPSSLWASALNRHLIPALQKQEKPTEKKQGA